MEAFSENDFLFVCVQLESIIKNTILHLNNSHLI